MCANFSPDRFTIRDFYSLHTCVHTYMHTYIHTHIHGHSTLYIQIRSFLRSAAGRSGAALCLLKCLLFAK
ncbi:hypothetical protein Y032_0491g2407 [Ancylostoma ceylanicum]|uniref:Uncharacterized protein n=1 Tax=Ancylostoma ceylanicum TaxID=53326 RepID=A0A016WWC0_9BILA|nr:hypothetical protein Y032_0491g2407 [Ancylostoma ceylanicum]